MSVVKDLAVGTLDEARIQKFANSHIEVMTYTTRYMSILKDLSIGQLNDALIHNLVSKHSNLLKLALRFPRVQAVLYCTRSLIEAENEGVVTRVVEYINLMYQKKTPFRICPPVIALSREDIELENPLVGKYLRYLPSQVMSGCFLATITREADDPKEAAKDILARAAARGIITGVPTKSDKKKKKGAKKKKDKKKKVSSPTRFSFGRNAPLLKEESSHQLVKEKSTHNSKGTSASPKTRFKITMFSKKHAPEKPTPVVHVKTQSFPASLRVK